jgi:hypothetical protein
MDESVAAIAFVDDIRPNIAYEMGIFHGKGRSILLLTRKPLDNVWYALSDLAGAALTDLNVVSIADAVNGYLKALYTDRLRRVNPVTFQSFPSRDTNILQRCSIPAHCASFDHSEYGKALRITSWEPTVDIPLGVNLAPTARAHLVMRGNDVTAEYAVYFRVRFKGRKRIKRRVWLGITSLRSDAWLTKNERQFPAQSLTTSWRSVTVDLSDLLRRGSLLGASPPDYLETVRFRAGPKKGRAITPYEVAFLGLSCLDTNCMLEA